MMRQHPAALGVLLLAALHTLTASAGDLNPPAGPVAPTMKPLVEIEPRTPVNALPGSPTAVHRITAPGSYYLTSNIMGEPGKNGIEVFITTGAERGVSIDLNGFALIGTPGSLNGIQSGFSAHVRNGVAAAWTGAGITIAQGIVENIRVRNNGGQGIRAFWSASIRNCTAEGNSGDGISAGDNCNIIECLSKGNGGLGISLDGIGVIRECAAYNNAAGGIKTLQSAIVTGCILNSNQGPGIQVQNNCRVTDNLVSSAVPDILVTGTNNRIEGNHVGGIIRALGTANIIARNSADVFDIAPGNLMGAVSTDPATASSWDNLSPP